MCHLQNMRDLHLNETIFRKVTNKTKQKDKCVRKNKDTSNKNFWRRHASYSLVNRGIWCWKLRSNLLAYSLFKYIPNFTKERHSCKLQMKKQREKVSKNKLHCASTLRPFFNQITFFKNSYLQTSIQTHKMSAHKTTLPSYTMQNNLQKEKKSLHPKHNIQ